MLTNQIFKSNHFASFNWGGVNRANAILFMVVMLLVGVQQIKADVKTLRRDFTATQGVQWYDQTDIDWNTQKVIVEVTNVSTTMSATKNNELISFCGSEFGLGWKNYCLSVYSSDGANLQVYPFKANMNINSNNATYSNHSVTFELTKASGLKVNGTVKANASEVSDVTNKSTLKIGCTDAAHIATYTVKIVPLDYSSTSNASISNLDITNGHLIQSLKENFQSPDAYWSIENVNIDFAAGQKLLVSVDKNGQHRGSGSRTVFAVNGTGDQIGWYDNSNGFVLYSVSDTQYNLWYFGEGVGNKSTGNSNYNNNHVLFEFSNSGLRVNNVSNSVFNSSVISKFLAKKSFTISNEQGNHDSFLFDYIRVVDSDFQGTSTSGNTLKEGSYNFFPEQNYVNVQLQRSALSTTDWNTFCVPFNISMADFKAVYGDDTKVWKFSAVDGNVMNFEEETTTIQAGVPYLVKPSTEGVANPTFYDVNISCTEPQTVGDGNYHMVGTFGLKQLNTENEFYLAAGGKFKLPSATSAPMKGMRAYFQVADASEANLSALRLGFDGGGTTGISEIVGTEAVVSDDARVFNLQGQCVGTSLNGLHSGIYVQNGKKYVVK